MKEVPTILRLIVVTAVALLTLACGEAADDGSEGEADQWSLVLADLPGALMSVWGTSSEDIWAVGADPGDGAGPAVIHFDGETWERLGTGHAGDLWWVFGFRSGPIYMGGTNGMILRYEDGVFERMQTPSGGTVYGIWGIAANDMWAVGGNVTSGAFAWRFRGTAWTPAPGFPEHLADDRSMFKVWGKSNADVWMVGTGGTTIHYDAADFTIHDSTTNRQLFTVHGDLDEVVTVGGLGTGVIIRNLDEDWEDVTPEDAPHLMGVHVGRDATYAVGVEGAVLRRGESGWENVDTGLDLPEHLHAVWQDSQGGVWAVGGQVLAPPLVDGVVIHRAPDG